MEIGGLQAKTPHLTFVLEHEGQIALVEPTYSLQRLASRYAHQGKGAEEEARLYVTEVQKSSIVGVLAAGAAAAVTFAAGTNHIFKCAENLKKAVEHSPARAALPRRSRRRTAMTCAP